MNTLTYLLYLLITYWITVHVGLRFYKNGRVYILEMLEGDGPLTDFINKILLIGYFLMNLGYAALMLQTWETVTTYLQMLVSIINMTGRILLTLALMHYINMATILWLSRRQNSLHHHKTK